jgi:hypothetical protein
LLTNAATLATSDELAMNSWRISENSVKKLSEKGFEQASERGFGGCSVPKSA